MSKSTKKNSPKSSKTKKKTGHTPPKSTKEDKKEVVKKKEPKKETKETPAASNSSTVSKPTPIPTETNILSDSILMDIKGCDKYVKDKSDPFSSKCESCYQGYALKEYTTPRMIRTPKNTITLLNTCQKCSKGCEECSVGTQETPQKCKKCYEGFTLNKQQKCSRCDPLCLKCSGNTSNCSSCLLGAYKLNNTCISCLPGCQVCDNKFTCKSCFDDLLINQNATMCIDLELKNTHSSLVYVVTAIFGLLVVGISLSYLVCSCCEFSLELIDPLEYLRYSELIESKDLLSDGGKLGDSLQELEREDYGDVGFDEDGLAVDRKNYQSAGVGRRGYLEMSILRDNLVNNGGGAGGTQSARRRRRKMESSIASFGVGR